MSTTMAIAEEKDLKLICAKCNEPISGKGIPILNPQTGLPYGPKIVACSKEHQAQFAKG